MIESSTGRWWKAVVSRVLGAIHFAPTSGGAHATRDATAPSILATYQSPWYVPVRVKYATALIVAGAWLALSTWLAQEWMRDLAAITGWPIALLIVAGIAFVPGFMNAFLIGEPAARPAPCATQPSRYPGISILIAAYNEEHRSPTPSSSIARRIIRGAFEVIVIDDGSTDAHGGDRRGSRIPVAAAAAPAAQQGQVGGAKPRSGGSAASTSS